jgi:hypothetical protein
VIISSPPFPRKLLSYNVRLTGKKHRQHYEVRRLLCGKFSFSLCVLWVKIITRVCNYSRRRHILIIFLDPFQSAVKFVILVKRKPRNQERLTDGSLTGSEFLTAEDRKNFLFLDIKPWSPLKGKWYLGWIHVCRFVNPEYWDDIFFWNICSLSTDYMALYHRRRNSAM